jgi:hypothetical protein
MLLRPAAVLFNPVLFCHVNSRLFKLLFPRDIAEKQDIQTGLKDFRFFRRRYRLGAAVRQSMSI